MRRMAKPDDHLGVSAENCVMTGYVKRSERFIFAPPAPMSALPMS